MAKVGGAASPHPAFFLLFAFLTAFAPCGTAVIPNGIGLGAPQPPTGLNPLLAGDIDTLQEAILLYRPLVWIGAAIDFDRERSLAAAVTPLDGNTRFRVVLKPWRWSDGTSITADDVLFGWARIEKLGDLYPYAGQGGIPQQVAAVRAVGPLTVDFMLKTPANPDWFTLNGLPLIYPLPRHAWGDPSRDDMWRRQTDPALAAVTDGPFRLVDMQPDQYFAYAPNPRYGGHPASLQRLVVAFLPGEDALHALQSGMIDMAAVPPVLLPHVRATHRFDIYTLPEPYGYLVLDLNQHSAAAPFLRDVRVRRAIAAAIDQQGAIRVVYRGLGSENREPAPTAPPTWRGETPHGPDFPGYDPVAARALLQAAGWIPGADGIRHRNGQRLSLAALSGAPPDSAEVQLLQFAQNNLRAVGIDLHLRVEDFTQMMQTIGAGGPDWEAASVPTTPAAMPDGMGTWNTGGAYNFGAYSDPDMDRLIAASVTIPGRDALFAYQAYAARTVPGIFLPQGRQPIAVARRLRGVEDFVNATGLWSPEYLHVDDAVCRGGAGSARPLR